MTLRNPLTGDCSLRTRKREETRLALVQAAYAIVRDSAFEDLTAEAVADRAGVSRRTFFNYFPSVESVLTASVAEFFASVGDGKTWSASYLPHHDGTPTEHGFASLFPVGEGFGLVWLDGRAMKAGEGHDGHPSTRPGENSGAGSGQGGGGAMSVRYGQFDKSFKQIAESAVDTRVCECCPTAAAVTAEGLITAYRDRSDQEVRDNYVSRFVKGKWTTAQPVFSDNWKIAACPVNGPALAANGRRVAMTWFTVKQEQGQAYLAFSDDAGATFGKPIRVDDGGSLGRVDVELLRDGAALATWIEFADQPAASGGGGRAQFRARRIEPNGTRSAAVTISGLAGSRASGYPRAAIANGEAIFAWTEAADGGGLQVRTASARVH